MNLRIGWREEPIGRQHDRKSFDCGAAELNDYLARYARQNHVSGGAKTFVAVDPSARTEVLGYYSISPGAVAFSRVPKDVAKGAGRYELPVFRLGRLAVAVGMQGRGLGGELLFAAGSRALGVAQEVGGVALAIDAKDAAAARWYSRFGSVPLLDDPLKLILPLATFADAVAAARSKRDR